MKKCCINNIHKAKRIGKCRYICPKCKKDVSFFWFLFMEAVKNTKIYESINTKNDGK